MLFSAATLSCCLFVGLCAFSFVFCNSNAFSVALITWLICIFRNIQFLCLEKFLVCFCSMLLVISYLLCEPAESEQSMALYTSEFMLPLLLAGTTSINTSYPVPLAALHAHTITLPPTCLTDSVVCFRSWAVSLHYSWFHLSKDSFSEL